VAWHASVVAGWWEMFVIVFIHAVVVGGGGGRHYIARLQGQPVLVGIFVDETYDIGRCAFGRRAFSAHTRTALCLTVMST
jgi:hypothetical protein